MSSPRKRGPPFFDGGVNSETEVPAFAGMTPWLENRPEMTKTLVIDNYDSFTYNLVHFLGELGAEMIVRRNDKITLEEIAAMAPEAIVLSPGPCTPNEAGICLTVI